MEVSGENLRFILGLKLRKFRNQRGLSLKQVAERTKLSLSFLSEIEKGKKYPKPEKLMLLARALEVPFDDLVSLKLDEELDALTSFLDSPFLREFPFELFGITPRDFLDLVSHSPSKAGAFLRTFMEIAQGYDMRVEHFILAALRSYQKMYLNYFEDIEKAVTKFNREFGLQRDRPVDFIRLDQILTGTYGYELSETGFDDYPDLRGFRAIWIKGNPPKLILNKNLLPVQKAFLVAREIGFCYLDLQERAATSSWIKVESFDQVLNNFRASYFAGAVLINRDLLRKDLTRFFHQKSWDGEAFRDLMRKYQATPEMFLYRLSQIIPKFFDLREIYYLRFNSKVGTETYRLTKELNMSRVRVPHGIGLNEHYCRRWLSISVLREMAADGSSTDPTETRVAAQRSRFVETGAEFFTITVGRPLALAQGGHSSISLGFLMNDAFKRVVRFWNDDRVPVIEVNETCERCGLSPTQCSERVAPPEIFTQEQNQRVREEALRRFMIEHLSSGDSE